MSLESEHDQGASAPVRHSIRSALLNATLKSRLPFVLLAIPILLSVNYQQQPRFDETGYMILAKSLAQGSGYRALDVPATPLASAMPYHAHYPPGWPLVLLMVFRLSAMIGISQLWLTHVTVVALWLVSLIFWYKIFMNLNKTIRINATVLQLALLMNWSWIRLAHEIHSESLFIPFTGLAILLFISMSSKSRLRLKSLVLTGVVLGLCFLSRHVGIALLAACLIELLICRKIKEAIWMTCIFLAVIMPWLVWQYQIDQATQVELLVSGKGLDGMILLISRQFEFYLQRMPDILFGPFLETATVFRDSITLKIVAYLVATAFLLNLVIGFISMFKESSLSRVIVLYLLCTLLILLIWPFTEAGRFLIPLVPVLLITTQTGIQTLFEHLETRLILNTRLPYQWLILILVLPFGTYTVAKSMVYRDVNQDVNFDQACQWIRKNTAEGLVVASRHPGDVFWRSGRKGIVWPMVDGPEELFIELKKNGCGMFIVDRDRFARAPIPRWASHDLLAGRSDLFREVRPLNWNSSAVEVYELVDMANPDSRRVFNGGFNPEVDSN